MDKLNIQRLHFMVTWQEDDVEQEEFFDSAIEADQFFMSLRNIATLFYGLYLDGMASHNNYCFTRTP